MHHFQHERVTDFRKMFQDMLTIQISFYSNVSRIALHFTLLNAHLKVAYYNTHSSQIVSKLQDTLDKFDVGQDYGGGGAVSNHGYSPNHDIPGYPGTDL